MKQWAVVTGGGRGIGAALCIDLAEKGYCVLAIDLNIQSLEELKKQCPSRDLIVSVQGDLTNEEFVNNLTTYIPKDDETKYLIPCQRLGNISRMEDINIADFEAAMKVNVISPIMVFQKLLPRLKIAKGRILHTDTLIDVYPREGAGAYGISKTAYHKLGQQLRLELAETDVCVGSAYPGLVNTEGMRIDLQRHVDVKLKPANAMEVHEKNDREGKFLKPSQSAAFLSFVLLQTTDEEFENVAWNAKDETYWDKWKK